MDDENERPQGDRDEAQETLPSAPTPQESSESGKITLEMQKNAGEITIQVADGITLKVASDSPSAQSVPEAPSAPLPASPAPSATDENDSDEKNGAAETSPQDGDDGEKSEDKERSISSDLIRGHINTIILRALDDGDKYGYEIISEIEKKSHGQYSMKQPSLYSALKRLEKDGFITSYWGGSVGGGRRKYFSLTEDGREISNRNRSEWEYSRTVIDSLISDRDFDFSQPAPTQVNMRVLRNSTSRVPTKSDEEEELIAEDGAVRERLLEEQTRMQEELATQREEFEAMRKRLEAEYAEEKQKLEEEKERLEEQLAAHESLLQTERERQAAILAEQERVLEAEKSENEANKEAFAAREEARDRYAREREELAETEQKRLREEISVREQKIRELREESERLIAEREAEIREERAKHDRLLANRKMEFEEERRRYEAALEEERNRAQGALEEEHRKYLAELERQRGLIQAEQEALFRERERDLIHQNYLTLVNAPPEQPRPQEYGYYSPVADPPPSADETGTEREYRAVIDRLYLNSVQQSPQAPRTAPAARPLEGVNYTDLEALAAHDGIKISTAGMKKTQEEVLSNRVFHKGKALFFSALIVFVICLIEGSIVLALQSKYELPLFYPYFIYGTGLALLLMLGVAYANRYGERAIRRNSNLVPINGAVAFILLVIATLILALAIRIDFTVAHDLATYVIIPIIYFFNVVIFAIAYFLQIRPKKD